MPTAGVADAGLPDDAAARRIAAYEHAALLAELTALERRLPVAVEPMPAHLRGRPDILAVIESQAGGRMISAAQHLVWALRKRWRGLRGQRDAAAPAAVAVAPVAMPAPHSGRQPRLLIDTTPTDRAAGLRGGIPRVVRELSRAGIETGLAPPVQMRDGALVSYGAEVLVRPGDIYLIADIFWYYLQEYQASVAWVKARGGQVALLVYDLFPLQYPSFFPAEVGQVYGAGLRALLAQSRICLGISRSVAASLAVYLADSDLPNRTTLQLGWFSLGVAPEPPGRAEPVRDAVAALFAAPPVFLSVGTVEPRKGYAVTLDACELAWRRGAQFRLVIIGRYGWRAEALQARLLGHAEWGKRLFWLRDANDAELELAYRRCYCLIQSSIAEGFGLPIIEAAFHETPVIASDLAVFREVGGPALPCYPVADAAALADRLVAALAVRPAAPLVQPCSWVEAVRALDRLLFPATESAASGAQASGAQASGMQASAAPAIGVVA